MGLVKTHSLVSELAERKAGRGPHFLGKHFGGWKPDLPDGRDKLFNPHRVTLARVATLPPFANTDGMAGVKWPVPYDQGQLGSCTGNGCAGLMAYQWLKQNPGQVPAMFSRLFIYWFERYMEGDVSQDAGAQIRDGIKVLAQYGAPLETDWPYNINQFKVKPNSKAIADAVAFQQLKYERVDNTKITQLQQCLASGFPIVFGATLYDSFESAAVARTGIVPMPGPNEQVIGGHCQVITAYYNRSKMFKVRNSWGPGWGKGGYSMFPYAYITNGNLCDDFWIIGSSTVLTG
jgi:C1A family cysteine protease